MPRNAQYASGERILCGGQRPDSALPSRSQTLRAEYGSFGDDFASAITRAIVRLRFRPSLS